MALANNYEETTAKPHFFDNYKAKKKKLEELMTEWEEITEEIEG